MKTIVLNLWAIQMRVSLKCKSWQLMPGCLFWAFAHLFPGTATAQAEEPPARPVIWLRGDLGPVTSAIWPDWRGEKWGATAISGEGPSHTASFNFNKALVFDGVNDYMKVSYSLEKLPAFTMIAVYHPADTTERGVWGAEKALARKAMLTTQNALGPDNTLDAFSRKEPVPVPVLSTVVQNWAETPAIGDSAFLALGSAGGALGKAPFKGTMAEFMVFDRALNFLERLQAETYLAIKYGIPLQNSNYVSSFEEVLWHGEDNDGFSSRIAGIGRDDAFSLYQKQSGSSHDTTRLLLVSAGAFAPSNMGNLSHINNGDFLLWGDNNGQLADKPGQGADTLLPVLERRWLLDATGATAHQVATDVQLNMAVLPASSLGYWLVVDRSGKGDFTADQLEYFLPDSVSADNVAFFRNIKWDTDRSGTDAFSFARGKSLLAVISSLQQPTCLVTDGGSAAITVVGGRAPYQYELKNTLTGFSQKWQGSSSTIKKEHLTAGEYTLHVTDADRSQSSRTFSLQNPDALLVDLGEDLQLAEGGEITLDATAGVPDSVSVTYTWEGSNGFRSTEGRVRITEPGDYKVTVTNNKGCMFRDEIKIHGPESRDFMVYPNIVSIGDSYRVDVSLPRPASISIKVYDLRGNLQHEVRGDNQATYSFRLPAKNTGMYMVVLQTHDSLTSKKIIIY